MRRKRRRRSRGRGIAAAKNWEELGEESGSAETLDNNGGKHKSDQEKYNYYSAIRSFLLFPEFFIFDA